MNAASGPPTGQFRIGGLVVSAGTAGRGMLAVLVYVLFALLHEIGWFRAFGAYGSDKATVMDALLNALPWAPLAFVIAGGALLAADRLFGSAVEKGPSSAAGLALGAGLLVSGLALAGWQPNASFPTAVKTTVALTVFAFCACSVATLRMAAASVGAARSRLRLPYLAAVAFTVGPAAAFGTGLIDAAAAAAGPADVVLRCAGCAGEPVVLVRGFDRFVLVRRPGERILSFRARETIDAIEPADAHLR